VVGLACGQNVERMAYDVFGNNASLATRLRGLLCTWCRLQPMSSRNPDNPNPSNF
jgi:hypothetical protein